MRQLLDVLPGARVECRDGRLGAVQRARTVPIGLVREVDGRVEVEAGREQVEVERSPEERFRVKKELLLREVVRIRRTAVMRRWTFEDRLRRSAL